METLGRNIAYYRVKKGLNQDDLARLLSVSKDLVIAWEKDEREPSSLQIDKIVSLFRISKEDILSKKEHEKIIPVYSPSSKGKYVGTCSRCGKTIYSNSKYGMGEVKEEYGFLSTSIVYEYDSKKNDGKKYFCEDCCKEIEAINKQNAKRELLEEKKNIKKALMASLLMGFVFLSLTVAAAVIIYFILNEKLISYLVTAGSIVVGYYVFSIFYTGLLKGNWIHNSICSFARGAFIKFPKKIQDNDGLDVLKTGFVKAIFLAVNYLIDSVALIVYILFLGVIAMFYWPKAKLNALSFIYNKEKEI